MARQKKAAPEAPAVNMLEITVGRVKKDLVWVFIGVVVSLACGLGIGSLFKF